MSTYFNRSRCWDPAKTAEICQNKSIFGPYNPPEIGSSPSRSWAHF
jgi:hypothetical protein